MTTEQPVEAEQWKVRAVMAENAVRHALFMERSGRLTSPDSKDTFAGFLEWAKPALLIRMEHQAIEVYKWADACDCDPNADDYEDQHSEPAEEDGYVCSRSFLGYVCSVCKDDEEQGGPEWKPEAVEWPCPSIAALNGASATEVNEIARKLLTATSEETPR